MSIRKPSCNYIEKRYSHILKPFLDIAFCNAIQTIDNAASPRTVFLFEIHLTWRKCNMPKVRKDNF